MLSCQAVIFLIFDMGKIMQSHPLSSGRDVSRGYRSFDSYFTEESLREELYQMSIDGVRQMKLGDPRRKLIPKRVGKYFSLVPLDDPTRDKTVTFFGFFAPVFRATSESDGLSYSLRRLEGLPAGKYKQQELNSSPVVLLWKEVRHPAVVSYLDVFISKDFGSESEIPSTFFLN